MHKGKIKLKEVHRREVLFALVLFTLPFLPLLHLLFPHTSIPSFKFFGLTFNDTWHTQQLFFWDFFRRLVFAIYCLLFYGSSNNKAKSLLGILFFLNTFDLFDYWLYVIKELTTSTMVDSAALLVSMIIYYFSPFLNDLKFRFNTKRLIFSHRKMILNYLIFGVVAVLLLSHNFSIFVDKQTLELPFFTMRSFGFPDIESFLWVLGFKISFLSIVIWWFFSEKRWWRYALLSPILVTFHQIRITLTPNESFFDELEFLNALPLFALVVLILTMLSKNAKNQYYFQALYNETMHRMERHISKKYDKRSHRIKEIKEKIEHLKSNHSSVDPTELLDLKKELENHLKRI